MKVKLGDLTAKQLYDICSPRPNCENCPLNLSGACGAFSSPSMYVIDKEIDLPDEEESENGKTDL